MKAGKRTPDRSRSNWTRKAAMEPGHEGREETPTPTNSKARSRTAAMEPGHEGREERRRLSAPPRRDRAAMEPGHEGREELVDGQEAVADAQPQWSPAMKAGKSNPPDPHRRPERLRRNGARP